MKTNTFQRSTLLVILAFASIYIVWGSTFLAILYGLTGFPPFILSGLRFFTAGLVLFLFSYFKKERSASLTDWKRNGIAGILILGGGTGLVAWAEQFTTSTEACVLIATAPFWFIALDKGSWKYYFSNRIILSGLLIGFLGLLFFMSGSFDEGHAAAGGLGAKTLAFIVLIISSLSWVAGSLYSKHKPASSPMLMNVAQQLLVGGVLSFVVALFMGEFNSFSLTSVPLNAWLGLGYLIVFGSIIAYLAYIWLLSVRNPVLVSTHVYVNPIVAVVAGGLFAGERINSIQLVALIIILVGVALINSSTYKPGKRTLVRMRRINYLFSRMINPYKNIVG